jgi:hypothetical protein
MRQEVNTRTWRAPEDWIHARLGRAGHGGQGAGQQRAGGQGTEEVPPTRHQERSMLIGAQLTHGRGRPPENFA